MAEPRDGIKGIARVSAVTTRRKPLARAGSQESTRRRMPRALSSLFADKFATFGAVVLIVVSLSAIPAPVISTIRRQQVDNRTPPLWSSEGSTYIWN